jgi:hypothetical protein
LRAGKPRRICRLQAGYDLGSSMQSSKAAARSGFMKIYEAAGSDGKADLVGRC